MTKRVLLIVAASLFMAFGACKNSTKETTNDPSETVSASEVIQQNQTEFYVMAASGLTLRKANTTASDKLAVMPYGSLVTLQPQTTQAAISVEHIEGSMQLVTFNGLEGYCFNGYLSPYPMPVKGVSVADYLAQLKAKNTGVRYEQKENGPDFHEGYSETITLPTAKWHEGYYMAQNLFDTPKSLAFPNPKGIPSEIIEAPTKSKEVWTSELLVKRTNNKLDTISYNFRSEGSGHGFTITKPDSDQLKIERYVFVD